MDGITGVVTNDLEKTIDKVIEHVGKDITLGTTIGLGKPILFANAMYRRAKSDPSINLKIIASLTPERPVVKSELEKRLAGPIIERIFSDTPEFEYMADLRAGKLPKNVELYEFYCKAGTYLNVPHAQQNHVTSNFTYIVRDCMEMGMNVFAQVIACKDENGTREYSMGSNADICVGGVKALGQAREQGKKVAKIAEVNENMPFMYGDAICKADDYDCLLSGPQFNYPLFAPPKDAIDSTNYMIGMNVSTLVKDGGTLQVGIGALGDSIVACLDMRHSKNDLYCKIVDEMGVSKRYQPLIDRIGGMAPFEKGLYGASEMFVDAFMQLYQRNIIKRKVFDNSAIMKLINEEKLSADTIPQNILDLLYEKKGIHKTLREKDFKMLTEFGILKSGLRYSDGFIYDGDTKYSADLRIKENSENIKKILGTKLKKGKLVTASFYLGPKSFYDALNNMNEEERSQFDMSGVEKVNQLYGDEELRRLQRIEGRFINSGMIATVLGSIASDQLEDGRVISGIGGQYNFVTMGQALQDARSILMIRSTKGSGKTLKSNIVYSYGHCSIPKHLKDIIVTEYGIADLRAKSDKETIMEMINITDSRFQDQLVDQAKKAGKLPVDYQVPEQYRNNTPDKINELIKIYRTQGIFNPFPFGSELTPVEMVLGDSLGKLKSAMGKNPVKIFGKLLGEFFKSDSEKALPFLKRMGFDQVSGSKEKILKKMVVIALKNSKYI